MSIQYQQNPFNQKLTMLSDPKYALTGDPIEGNKPGRNPKLFLEMNGNYPRVRVQLNNGQKGDDGRIVLNLDLVAAMSIITALEDATHAKEPCVQLIEVKRRGYDRAANKSTEPYGYAWIAVGKNSDGCEFIGVQRGKKDSKNYLKLNFNFTHPEFHPILDGSTGQEVTRQKLSNIIARGFVKLWSSLLPIVAANVWDYNTTPDGKWALEQAAKNPRDGQSGGYQQYANNRQRDERPQQSSYTPPAESSSPDASFDDEFPF